MWLKVWEVHTGRCIHTMAGHRGEISSTQFDFTGELCISGSIDRTCKIWNVDTGACINTLRGCAGLCAEESTHPCTR